MELLFLLLTGRGPRPGGHRTVRPRRPGAHWEGLAGDASLAPPGAPEWQPTVPHAELLRVACWISCNGVAAMCHIEQEQGVWRTIGRAEHV